MCRNGDRLIGCLEPYRYSYIVLFMLLLTKLTKILFSVLPLTRHREIKKVHRNNKMQQKYLDPLRKEMCRTYLLM